MHKGREGWREWRESVECTMNSIVMWVVRFDSVGCACRPMTAQRVGFVNMEAGGNFVNEGLNVQAGEATGKRVSERA